jgi:excisionase family DNA binding protein
MAKHKKPGRSAAPSQAPVRDIMDIKALAHYLGLGKSKIYALIRQKKIPASRIGRQYRFSKNIVDQWLNERLITQDRDSQMSLFKEGTH